MQLTDLQSRATCTGVPAYGLGTRRCLEGSKHAWTSRPSITGRGARLSAQICLREQLHGTKSQNRARQTWYECRMRTRGAGPRTTLPWLLYCDPWQGHLNLLSVWDQGTTQPASLEQLSLARERSVNAGRLATACHRLRTADCPLHASAARQGSCRLIALGQH